jgi:hypothetical protein
MYGTEAINKLHSMESKIGCEIMAEKSRGIPGSNSSGRIFTIFLAKKAQTRHSMMDGADTPSYNHIE